jgi:hypothetical protein
MEEHSSSISQISTIVKYFERGFTLGLIFIGGFLLVGIGGVYFYPSYYRLISSSVFGAIFYAVAFGLAGGVNQKLAEHILGIKCEQNIGTGLRDGFVLFVFFNVVFVPVSMMFSYPAWALWFSPSPLQIFLLVSFAIPVYIFLLGIISRQVASFLHADEEPTMPSDFVQHSYKCPHCSPKYYYGLIHNNQNAVTCQNCAKQFSID